MNIIIFGAGKGSRLKANLPKPLVKIKGKSILEYQVETLRSTWPSAKIFIIGGYKGELLKAEAQKFGINYIYNKKYATASVNHTALKSLQQTDSPTILRIDGDLLPINPRIFQDLKFQTTFFCQEGLDSGGEIIIDKKTLILSRGKINSNTLVWSCCELYINYEYQNIVTEYSYLNSLQDSYFNLLNKAIKDKLIKPQIHILKKNSLIEIDTKEDYKKCLSILN